VTNSQQFIFQLLGKCIYFYALVFDINQTWYTKKYFVPKHRLVKKKIVQSRKIYASVCSMFAMSIADTLLLVYFFVSRKMSCWQCCCSCLQHGGLEAKALVVEHFGVCCTLCGLRPFFEMYI
jgi:hypothetical protein